MNFFSHFYFAFFCLSMASICLYAAPKPNEDFPGLSFPKEDFNHNDERLKHGDELFEAALYEKAIDIYKDLILELSQESFENNERLNLLMQTRFHLAHAYFSLEKYQKAAEILNENLAANPQTPSLPFAQLYNHSLYLKALALRNLKENKAAKETFLTYINSKTPNLPTFYEEALFEIGLIDFNEGKYYEASHSFDVISNQTKNSRMNVLSKLYQARIAQHHKNYSTATRILEPLNSKLVKDDPLHCELNYLQGEVEFALHNYTQAAFYFKQALPKNSPEKNMWYADTLYQLGWSYLKIGEKQTNDLNEQIKDLKKAEEIFDQLVLIAPKETTFLALAQCYLSQGNLLKEPRFYAKAEELLSKEELYVSKEGEAQALLLRAEAAPTYAARDQFYRKLTEEEKSSGIFYAKGWYMRALNDFEHGQLLMQTQNSNAAYNSFERSAMAFRKSFELLKDKELQLAGAALKYQALAVSYLQEEDKDSKAFHILDELMSSYPHIWDHLQNKDEIYYLHGYFAGRIASNNEKYLEIAKQSLQNAATIPNNAFGDQALRQLGTIYYNNKEDKKAENIYLQLTKDYPNSPLAAEAWLWAACCADNLQEDIKIGKERRLYAYENFPKTSYAAEAFFTYYTYPEYLQGDRTTIKHLRNFTEHYSDTPFLIDAHYLIGLDYKRDRKTAEGRWIRKKSLTDAIDSFQQAEMLFDELSEKKLIPVDKLDYYTSMRYRATLERAMSNLAIAEEAQGAKRQIYLDYAEDVFKNLVKELRNKKNPYVKRLYQENNFPLIEEECSFWLAQTYIKANKEEEANRILSDLIARYQAINITKGYYLSRTFEEQGKITMRNEDYWGALHLFKKAEDAAKGNVLSTDQKLELWIQQSLCYRGLHQFDDAILILSKVINDDAISALRVKAMYMRAETYELQKRPELARKQLESMVNKGGIWAQKAQEKLDKDDLNYGH